MFFFGKMYLNPFRQDIKKIFLLIAFKQSLNSRQKTADFRRYWQILVKNRCRFTAGDLKAFFLFFCFDFLHIDLSNNFRFCKFFAKSLKSEGERLKVKFCNGCLEKFQKNSLLAVAILFLFTFFNLILDARIHPYQRPLRPLTLYSKPNRRYLRPLMQDTSVIGVIGTAEQRRILRHPSQPVQKPWGRRHHMNIQPPPFLWALSLLSWQIDQSCESFYHGETLMSPTAEVLQGRR